MNKVQEYLQKIRELDGFQNAILYGITVTKRTHEAEFSLVTDKTYTPAEERFAQKITQSFMPDGFTAQVKIIRRVPDAEMIRAKIFAFLSSKFPAAAAFMKEDRIEVEMLTSGAQFYVGIASGQQTLFDANRMLDEVSAYLSSVFCGSFYGNVRLLDLEMDEEEIEEEEVVEDDEPQTSEVRRFPIWNFAKIDGADEQPHWAVYMADVAHAQNTFAVCGTLTYVEEKFYTRHNEKTNADVEKSRFVLALTDGTATIRTTYFPKKSTLDKIRELKAGDKIVVLGSNETYNNQTSFKATKINYGHPPENFEPVARKSKPVPKAYKKVFPEPYVDYTQAGFFDNSEKPDDLKKHTFVVFDIETTGLNHNPAMGKMDKIIELGAVKIENGEMSEKFSTFIACPDRLSKEIVELTGITDSDLIGAPEVDQVLQDFFKFADGAILVAHNAPFDCSFVQYYGEQIGYMFDHKRLDTCVIAQEVLRGKLPNYKLNSVADFYGFSFNHHRAFDDACVTAKIFIEMIKARGRI